MTCGIYCIEYKPTKMMYIGLSTKIENRFKSHNFHLKNNKHANPILQRYWNKHKESTFKFYIIEECQPEELEEKEIFYIETLNTLAPNGFNILKGGRGAYGIPPKKDREEIYEKSRKRILTPEQIERIRKMNIGRKHAEETLEKMANSYLKNVKKSKEKIREIIESGEGVPMAKKDENGKYMGRFYTSSYLGVKRKRAKWEVSFAYKNQNYYVGLFNTELEAAFAYDNFVIDNNLDRILNFSD